MKQFSKYLCFFMLIGMSFLSSQAREININADDIKGDFTMKLRAMCERARYDDTVILTFGNGTYTIDGTIQFKCNVIIKGAGKDKTKVLKVLSVKHYIILSRLHILLLPFLHQLQLLHLSLQ